MLAVVQHPCLQNLGCSKLAFLVLCNKIELTRDLFHLFGKSLWDYWPALSVCWFILILVCQHFKVLLLMVVNQVRLILIPLLSSYKCAVAPLSLRFAAETC